MEEKIKVYVSEEVGHILLKDMELFEFYKKDRQLNKNDFINTLILHYHESYQQSNSELFEYIRRTLEKEFVCSEQKIGDIAYDILKYTQSKAFRPEKGKLDSSFSIKPTKKSKAVIQYIQECLLSRTTMSNYFRNMLSSYCLLPQDKREEVIFRDKFEEIRSAIDNDRKIYLKHKYNDSKYVVSPYAVSGSKEELFNYLIAEYNGRPYSFRISRLEKVIALNEVRSFKEGMEGIFDKMIAYGPQFAFEKEREICVRLEPYGRLMFEKVYLHRPKPIRVEGDRYYFDCSDNQIIQYFFRFGKFAYIETPVQLREEMLKRYRMAARAYTGKSRSLE